MRSRGVICPAAGGQKLVSWLAAESRAKQQITFLYTDLCAFICMGVRFYLEWSKNPKFITIYSNAAVAAAASTLTLPSLFFSSLPPSANTRSSDVTININTQPCVSALLALFALFCQ
ncbi:unnamed protein product [Ceratitis capitata]|uniref:(Mediterranean fruit fly) hypothetical protein n=1 Tax=Ceratitis capitata TaxID=7213 RepID=A0A811UMF9_CERCA|nr:unnamed protein product [Ceratitis capitata]